jgi:hypothetical protein
MDSGFTRASDMQNTKLFEHIVSPAIVAKAGFDGMDAIGKFVLRRPEE